MRWVINILLIGFFLLRLDIQPNDDTYVYFNYARTFLDGFPFCYDGRGIPSEGFTSILYLLLLLPFEALGLNMMFAAVLLNLSALLGCVWLVEKIVSNTQLLPEPYAKWSGSLFLGILLLDPNLLPVVGRGLETMIGVMAVLLAVYFWVKAVKGMREAEEKREARWVAYYLIACFGSFLIRPEGLPPLALAGVYLLFIHPNKLKLLAQAGAFGLVMTAYFAWKYLYFGDVFPTGFYRKISAGHLDGYLYIRQAVLDYLPQMIIVGLGILGITFWQKKQKQPLVWLKSPAVYFLACIALFTLIFHYYVLPMVGYGYRHLFVAIVILYMVLAVVVLQVIQAILRQKNFTYAIAITCSLLLVYSAYSSKPFPLKKLNLYAQAEAQTSKFYYVQLGQFLRNHLPSHRDITLIYGDAGALPYELRCKFIDTNGLSEPAIAHFFGEPDTRQKADAFADYLLSWSPDLLIIAGDTAADGRVPHAITQHDPFRALRRWGHYDSEKLWAYERLKQAGFRYHHSASGYFYDLHFLVREGSPYVGELQAALAAHQAGIETYILRNGLFFYNERREVQF